MEVAAAEATAVGAQPTLAAAPLPSPHKQAAPPASPARGSQPTKQPSVALKAQRTCCPACGAPPLTEEELQTVRKPGRRSTRDANDPRNRPENLVKIEFLQQHIVKGGMSLREISAYHGYTISTLSRRAKQLGVQVGRPPRVASDTEQASEGTAVRSPAPTPPRKRPPQDKQRQPKEQQQGKEEAQGSPSKRRRSQQAQQPGPQQAQRQGQPAKGSGGAGAAAGAPAPTAPAEAAAAPPPAAAAAAAAAASSASTPPATAEAAASGSAAVGPGNDAQPAAKRRRPSRKADKPQKVAQHAVQQRPLVPVAIAPGVAAATATAAAAMGPLLALPVKRADLQKSNLGPAAAAAAAPAQLVHLWQPPSKEQLEIWQAVQAQAAAAAASAQAQRPAAALPLWQPVVLPPTSGLQHSPPKPPRPALSQPQQKASPVPRRRRPAARQPQVQLSMLEDSDDEDAIAGLVSLRHQSREPSAGPPPTAAISTAAAAAAAAAADPAVSAGAVEATTEALPAPEVAQPAAAGVPAAAAPPAAAAAALAATAEAEPVTEAAAQGDVKQEPLPAAAKEQQAAAVPSRAEQKEPPSQDGSQGLADQQQPPLQQEQLGSVEVKREQCQVPDSGMNDKQAAGGFLPAALLPAALRAEAHEGVGSRVGSQPSQDGEVLALLPLPGTQQSACCPAEEAALLSMPQAQQRARGRDTQWPQPAQHGQSQGLAAQQHEAPLPSEQQHNGAAAPAAAAEADATPAASTGGPPVSPELERVCVQAAQHLLQNMLAAFDKADDSSGESMLRPLRRLLLAGQGGRTLQDIVAGWAGYSLPQQQEIFNTAVLAAKTARWQDLEDQLRLALELIS